LPEQSSSIRKNLCLASNRVLRILHLTNIAHQYLKSTGTNTTYRQSLCANVKLFYTRKSYHCLDTQCSQTAWKSILYKGHKMAYMQRKAYGHINWLNNFTRCTGRVQVSIPMIPTLTATTPTNMLKHIQSNVTERNWHHLVFDELINGQAVMQYSRHHLMVSVTTDCVHVQSYTSTNEQWACTQ